MELDRPFNTIISPDNHYMCLLSKKLITLKQHTIYYTQGTGIRGIKAFVWEHRFVRKNYKG